MELQSGKVLTSGLKINIYIYTGYHLAQPYLQKNNLRSFCLSITKIDFLKYHVFFRL